MAAGITQIPLTRGLGAGLTRRGVSAVQLADSHPPGMTQETQPDSPISGIHGPCDGPRRSLRGEEEEGERQGLGAEGCDASASGPQPGRCRRWPVVGSGAQGTRPWPCRGVTVSHLQGTILAGWPLSQVCPSRFCGLRPRGQMCPQPGLTTCEHFTVATSESRSGGESAAFLSI